MHIAETPMEDTRNTENSYMQYSISYEIRITAIRTAEHQVCHEDCKT